MSYLRIDGEAVGGLMRYQNFEVVYKLDTEP